MRTTGSRQYAKLHLGAARDGLLYKTQTLRGTQSPIWNEQFDFHGIFGELLGTSAVPQSSKRGALPLPGPWRRREAYQRAEG